MVYIGLGNWDTGLNKNERPFPHGDDYILVGKKRKEKNKKTNEHKFQLKLKFIEEG